MQMVGVGIVGSGFMGLTYSEVVARHAAGCSLVAVAGGRRAQKLAEDYGVAANLPSIRYSRGTIFKLWCSPRRIWIAWN